jgi:tetratricopeptide (TPR) repeat protein
MRVRRSDRKNLRSLRLELRGWQRPIGAAIFAAGAFAAVAAFSPPALADTAPARAAVPAAAPGAAPAADDSELVAARAATDRRNFAAALPLFERLVQRFPWHADLLIEAARVHGWADRNARAAELYRQALAAAPQRRADIVPSLAWQTAWAGHSTLALPLFEEAAALRPGDRALGWALANALNGAGRHRAAIGAFNRWLPPTSEAERLDLARALRWAGFEDRAWPLVADVRAPDAVWQRDHRFARDVAPFGYGALETAEDRDGLRSHATTVGAGLRPLAGAAVELAARRQALDDPFGGATATSVEASARLRLGEPDATAGTFWPQLLLRSHQVRGLPRGPWSPFTSTVRLKWLPADHWRLDAEHTRELVETPRALDNRVHVTVQSLGADWKRDERLMLAGAAARLRFDDGTQRERLAARAEWALQTQAPNMRPRWTVGFDWGGFRRTAEGAPGADARGYWNPRRYNETRLTTGLKWDRQAWELHARLGLARSREVDSGGNASRGSPHLWEMGAAWELAPAWQLRAGAGGSGQGLGLTASGASGAGYWRRWANVALQGWF